jgi:hypothetical protein
MRVLIGVIAVSAGISIAVSATPAKAGCHLVDCVENVFIKPQEVDGRRCEDLYILRNAIYKDAGYCFRSERARRSFTNEGCVFEDVAAVPLNAYQKHNVGVIRLAEARRGC